MGEPALALTSLAGSPMSAALLMVGPSLGTCVEDLWRACAVLLGDGVHVVGWDLPGHGQSAPTRGAFTVEDVASAVRTMTATVADGRPAAYAGVSFGGMVGLALADRPGPFGQLTCIAAAAVIGTPQAWHERAALVRGAGTAAVVEGSAQRWFAPDFATRHPAVADRLLAALLEVDGESYALACEALATADLHADLADAAVPVLLAPGEHDVVVPPDVAARTAAATTTGRLEALAGCGHLPPAETPDAVARLLRRQIEGILP
jgi:pimeloyl-ACP methyl ester carboxylesterase